jgi:uncharacterized protein (TIGR02145 family)
MLNKSIMVKSSILIVLILPLIISCSSKKSTSPMAQVPTLTTATVSEIGQTTAQCGGTITSDGGAAVIHRGVCWRSDSIPVYSDNKTYDGTGTGSFVSSITGLTRLTRYYVRAYAMNDAGIGYGDIDSFTTTDSLGTVSDIDGNSYLTIKIGDQWWMAENLKVRHYNNGDSIPVVADSIAWGNLTTGAYCNYNNDTAYNAVYGRLYNWYAVGDSRNIAPAGWHVPSDSEWQILNDYLGGQYVAGGKMKEAGTTHWQGQNVGATNESNFSALPGGYRRDVGFYNYLGYHAYFWSSIRDYYGYTTDIVLNYDDAIVVRVEADANYGFSIRCVRD